MPDELFCAMYSHNSAPNSDIAGTPRFFSTPFCSVLNACQWSATPLHWADHKGIKLFMCKHNVIYDLWSLTSIYKIGRNTEKS